MSNDEQAMREVPHVEIRRTDVRKIVDADVRHGIEPAVKMLREILAGREQESFVILIVDGPGRVTAWREVARGRQDRVEVPTRELFRTALMLDASYLICAHNHPSGDPTPSPQDLFLTSRLREAGEMINVPILEHVIIGEGDRYATIINGAVGRALNVSGDREPPEF